MSNWYYYDKNGNKVGPITTLALKALAQQGMIAVETVVENEQGRTSKAGEINGLFTGPMPPIQNYAHTTPARSFSNSTKVPLSFWNILDFSFKRFYFFEFIIGICKVVYALTILLCLLSVGTSKNCLKT